MSRRKKRRVQFDSRSALEKLTWTWKRCGYCGNLCKVPEDARGWTCRTCGGPLTRARSDEEMLSGRKQQTSSEKVKVSQRSHAEERAEQKRRKAANLQNADAIVDDVRAEALQRGLVLLVSRGSTVHWMYERWDTGERVGEYWPVSGKHWCPATGEKWVVADPWESLDLAYGRRNV